MNFLLHAHLARRDRGTAEGAVGAMLPDLWRMIDRRVRARTAIAVPDDASDPLRAVLGGIDHHLFVDRWFHGADVFLRGEEATRLLLARAVPGGRRVALLAHVAWELCLDGALIEREGLETMLVELRVGFARAIGAPSDRAADLHYFAAPTAVADRAAFTRRVAEVTRALQAGPWIAGYLDGDGLASRLSGVRSRLGAPPFDAREHARVAEAMTEVLADARGALDGLLAGAPRLPA